MRMGLSISLVKRLYEIIIPTKAIQLRDDSYLVDRSSNYIETRI